MYTPSGSTPLLPRAREEEKAAGGAGGRREVARILPDPHVSQDGSRGGPSKTSTEASHVRPTIGGRPLTKSFLKRD